MSFYAYAPYTANGATQTFAVPFPYLKKADVQVFVNGVADLTFTWPSTVTVTLTAMPANGAVVLVKRVTPRTANVNFYDASTLTESNLNSNTTQLIYLIQEQLDAAALCLSIATDGTWDGQSRRLTSIVNPTAAQDAATKAYVDLGNAATLAAQAAAAASQAAAAASQAAAATSETNAANSAASLSGTSASSLLIGTGAKAFVTQAGKLFPVGVMLLLSSHATPANYMHGQVTSYAGTALGVNVIDVGGAGTFADWDITVSGTQGSTGAAGAGGVSPQVADNAATTIITYSTLSAWGV